MPAGCTAAAYARRGVLNAAALRARESPGAIRSPSRGLLPTPAPECAMATAERADVLEKSGSIPSGNASSRIEWSSLNAL